MSGAGETQEEATRTGGSGALHRAALVVVPPVAAAIIASTWLTARERYVRPELIERPVLAGQRFILAFWHCQLWLMRYAYPASRLGVAGRRLAAVISAHRDGELIARTMALLGHGAARGSSTRGGDRALRQSVRLARDGWDVAITPDGPRGPARVAKQGAIEIARLTGLPILPAAVAADRALRLRSWDRFEVPLPFARVVFAFGPMLDCPREATPGDREALRGDLERRLQDLDAECRAAVAAAPGRPA